MVDTRENGADSRARPHRTLFPIVSMSSRSAMPAVDPPRLRLVVLGGAVAACLWLSSAAMAADAPQGRAPSAAERGPQRELTPEERRERWQSLSPEQRELMMRRMPKDERRQVRQQMTPEQRDEMRQRFTEKRERGAAEGRARLTPEERQRLREQIRESQRDWKKKPAPDDQRGRR